MTTSLSRTSAASVTRIRVLVGDDDDPALRNGKTLVAQSQCSYYCPDRDTVDRCIEALRESDEKLRRKPEELMLWNWMSTWFEADANNPNGGGTVMLGVAWYDEDFFQERNSAGTETMHKKIYARLGIPMENVTITHWRPVTTV
jgi:hypothetical protein